MDKTPQQLRRERLAKFQLAAERAEAVPEIMLFRMSEGQLLICSGPKLTDKLLDDIEDTFEAYRAALGASRAVHRDKGILRRIYKFLTPRRQKKKAEWVKVRLAELNRRMDEWDK